MFLGAYNKKMAHYAFLDNNNIVTEVIVGKDENEDDIDWEQKYGEIRGQVCKRTSYNTISNTHQLEGIPFRKNYASIGYSYNSIRDAFIPPKPYKSWIFNENTCNWDSPVAMPEDAGTGEPSKLYVWDEETTSWILINPE